MPTILSKAASRRLQERVSGLQMQLRYAKSHRMKESEIARLERELAEAQKAKGSK